jgi:2-amino-4-hydroxy-6-hydroxymethyldihydropteridine diphosphokinase
MDQILIKDLLLRTYLGLNPEERIKKQDVLLNIVLYADLKSAGYSDAEQDAVNYKTITKKLITMVEASRFKLVERLAAEVANLSLVDSRVSAVKVSVEKPGALRFARSVGVEIYRTRHELAAEPNRVFITIGSNIEPTKNIKSCLNLLSDKCTILRISPIYVTQPVGTINQPDFHNTAVVVHTPFTAQELKNTILLPIEESLDRKRVDDKNAARTIDLDIALYNYEVFDYQGRHIPDPDILRYAHIAVPLSDLAPYYVHPETGQSLAEIASSMSKQGIVHDYDLSLQKTYERD